MVVIFIAGMSDFGHVVGNIAPSLSLNRWAIFRGIGRLEGFGRLSMVLIGSPGTPLPTTPRIVEIVEGQDKLGCGGPYYYYLVVGMLLAWQWLKERSDSGCAGALAGFGSIAEESERIMGWVSPCSQFVVRTL